MITWLEDDTPPTCPPVLTSCGRHVGMATPPAHLSLWSPPSRRHMSAVGGKEMRPREGERGVDRERDIDREGGRSRVGERDQEWERVRGELLGPLSHLFCTIHYFHGEFLTPWRFNFLGSPFRTTCRTKKLKHSWRKLKQASPCTTDHGLRSGYSRTHLSVSKPLTLGLVS